MPLYTRRQKIAVFGASGHAKVVLDILHRSGHCEIIGLLDKFKPIGSQCAGHAVVGVDAYFFEDGATICLRLEGPKDPDVSLGVDHNSVGG